MNAFSSLFGMSGWRAPWSSTKPRIRLQTDPPHQTIVMQVTQDSTFTSHN